jgi:Pyruvate/2-oxoacid:ferredoxin oxidoreductase delta subunit
MSTVVRKIITIEEDKCDGCGNCVPACVEGALQVIDGKARLVKESYCDGLGACLGDCPRDALHVVEMEVESYDEPGVLSYLSETSPELVQRHVEHLKAHGMASSYTTGRAPASAPRSPVAMCPSVQVHAWDEPVLGDQGTPGHSGRVGSELRQWPVQLTLVPPNAPYFRQADLTLIADCVPFANPNMHADFMRDGAIAVGCPKLDDGQAYIRKLTEIIVKSEIRSIRVAYMEVPCCRGMVFIAEQAILASGRNIPLQTVLVAINP